MAIIETILLLVTLVVLSNVTSHYLVAIPGSLIQITLGIAIALLFDVKIAVDTSWFMLLFVAPILFFDGSRFPKKELWSMKKPIIANAIFLVILSTLLVGMIIHWIVPDMPLATSFALAGILAPTDPLAVQSISKKAKLPSNLMHLVSGESLINDASGLICFKYGVAATVSGYFSLKDASIEFFYIAIVGAIIGLVLMWVVDFLELFIYQQGIDDTTLHTIIRVITPFAFYFIAEEVFHASGVVAVVVAGIFKAGTNNKKFSIYSSELQVVATKTWDLVVYLLNGIVFVILGIELPTAMRSIVISDHSTMLAIVYAVIVWLSILIVRTIWSFVYDLFSRKTRASFQKAILSGLSGVRGAVTMIGVLSLPLVVSSGQPFPRRTMILFIASGVIILSLLAATILIPLISKNTTPLYYRGSALEEDENEENGDYISKEEADIYVTKIAIQYLEGQRRQENQQAALDLINEYEKYLAAYQVTTTPLNSGFVPDLLKQSIVLHTVTLKAEMETLEQLHDDQVITDDIFHYEQRKLDQVLNRLTNTINNKSVNFFRLFAGTLRLNFRKLKKYFRLETKKHRQLVHDSKDYEKIMAKNAIKRLSEYVNSTDKEYSPNVVYQVASAYRQKVENLKHKDKQQAAEYEEQLNALRTAVLTEQRTAIQELFEQGRLSRKTASNMRTKINYTENSMNIELEE